MDWDDFDPPGRWRGAGSAVLFCAVALGGASFAIAREVWYLARLAMRDGDRAADYPDFDL
jgi:hypothetical protein